MMRRAVTGIWLAWLMAAWGALAQAAPASDAVQGELRQRLAGGGEPLRVGDEKLIAAQAVARFYAARGYRPAWSPIELAEQLLATVARAGDEGLRPADYHKATLAQLLEAARKGASPAKLAELELVASDAFLGYARHLLAGRLDPKVVDKDWVLTPRSRDLVALLNEALAKRRVNESLAALAPQYPGYARLREGLARLREQVAAGGWPTVTPFAKGEKVEAGGQDPRVAEVRARLRATGELGAALDDGSALYDEALQAAVRRFQNRHGLTEDGVIGPGTVAALNVGARERLRQVELNLERWRWLPGELGKRHIVVNIPGFEMAVYEGGTPVFDARVVVGQSVKPTPVFTGRMDRVVLSPTWNVPHSIASEEILPKLKRDPGYALKQNIRIFGANGEVDPLAVNWGAYGTGNFPFRLRQEPGEKNPLGRVKFLFPNRYDVYLHDTSNPALFERAQRTFSHGCIRISKPLELAEYLLRHDRNWNRTRLVEAMDAGKERAVALSEAVPIHMLYWTAWVDADGELQFRNDIYQRDRQVVKALQAL